MKDVRCNQALNLITSLLLAGAVGYSAAIAEKWTSPVIGITALIAGIVLVIRFWYERELTIRNEKQ